MKYDFTVAHIAWEGDGSMGLFNGDELVLFGDEYHDDINTSIDSFICGVKFTGAKVGRQEVYVSDEFVDDCDYDCPESLTSLKVKWPGYFARGLAVNGHRCSG